MYLKLTCHRDNLEETLTSYEIHGFSLREKHVQGDEVHLTLDAPSIDTLSSGVYGDSKGFLEFSDGTVSPLYVRRDLWLDD